MLVDAVGLTCNVLEDHPRLKWHLGTGGQEWNVFMEGYECLGYVVLLAQPIKEDCEVS